MENSGFNFNRSIYINISDELKHWGDGTLKFLCGLTVNPYLLSSTAEGVTCIECLKKAWNNENPWILINESYPWIPDKIKELEYKQDFKKLLEENKK